MSDLIDLTTSDSAEIIATDALTTAAAAAPPPPLSLAQPSSAAPIKPTVCSTPARFAFMQHPLIVDEQRNNFDSNPFDQAQHIADGFDDPFESVHSKVLQTPAKVCPLTAVNVATLIQLDSAANSPCAPKNAVQEAVEGVDTDKDTDRPCSRTDADLDDSMGGFANPPSLSVSTSSLIQLDSPCVKQPGASSNEPPRDNHKSLTKPSGQLSANTKRRSGSLDQLVRRNQMLKQSIANAQQFASPPMSPNPSRDNNNSLASLALEPPNESFDDLMATTPEWLVDSMDDSTSSLLRVPQATGIHHRTEQTAKAVESLPCIASPTKMEVVPEIPEMSVEEELAAHLGISAPSKMSVVPEMPEMSVEEELAAHLGASDRITLAPPPSTVETNVDVKPVTPPPVSATTTTTTDKREHLASLLASVKNAIEGFDNHSEAKAMLHGLNSALADMTPSGAAAEISDGAARGPIVRQGTFNLEQRERDEKEEDSGMLADADVSPNTTEMANVVEHLGRLNLGNLQSINQMVALPNDGASGSATTYIVVMNTPIAAAATAAVHPVGKTRTKSSTAAMPTVITTATDDDSPSSYLKTRGMRSVSLSMAQKPSAVAQAIAAKAAIRQRANQTPGLTPLRPNPAVRRSSFSHASNSLAPPPTAGTSQSGTRRSMCAPPNRSPRKILPKSPSKLSSYTRRSISTRSTTASTSSASTAAGPPTFLKAAPSVSQLKLRSAPAPAAKPGPLRATVPVRTLTCPKPSASTTATATSTDTIAASLSVSGIPLGTPRKSSALAHSTPAVPRAAPMSAVKRLPSAHFGLGAGSQPSGLARRRSMSEGKTPSAIGGSIPMRSGIAAPGRRLSTLPSAGRNKENLQPK